MAPRTSSRSATKDTTPEEPQVVPMAAGYGMPGHDFTLQAVMELQKSVGKLEATLESLCGHVKEQSDKIDKIDDHLQKKIETLSDKVSSMSHKMYAAGVVLAILVVVGGWVVNKSWDLVQSIAAPAIKTSLTQEGHMIGGVSQNPTDPARRQ